MGTKNNSGGAWMIDYGLLEDTETTDYIWGAPQILMDHDPAVSSAVLGFNILQKEEKSPNTKKRTREKSRAPPDTKAGREKMRRDRLNDRFTELCSILEPGKPPKADKVAILSDAARLLKHLRNEAKKLKESNEALQENIKNLKAEKMQLRDEKVRLKAKKERMEQMAKGVGSTPAFPAQPATATLDTASISAYNRSPAYLAQAATASISAYNKSKAFPNYMPVGMWQWIPPASLDTSQDHVLRPPVA